MTPGPIPIIAKIELVMTESGKVLFKVNCPLGKVQALGMMSAATIEMAAEFDKSEKGQSVPSILIAPPGMKV